MFFHRFVDQKPGERGPAWSPLLGLLTDLVRRFIAHFTSATAMDKHTLSVVIVLLLLSVVAAQGSTLAVRYLRESASSSGTDSSGNTVVTVGDPILDFSSRDAGLADLTEAAPTPLSSTGIEDSPIRPTFASAQDTISSEAIGSTLTRSPLPQISSPLNSDHTISSVSTPASVDVPPFATTTSPGSITVNTPLNQETNIADEIRSSLSSAAATVAHSSPEPTTAQTAAPVPVYTFSSSSTASVSPTPISSNMATSQSTTSSTPSQDEGITSYSTGAVSTTEERAAIESTALELSSSPQQIEDASTPSTSTVSATAPSTDSKAPTSDERATSTSDRSQTNDQAHHDAQDQGDNDGSSSTSPPTSYSALRSPILYACVVLAVAGLVGAVFAFRAKRKCDVRDERGAVTEAAAATPPLPRHTAWAPPISQVRVVIDDRNFAML